MGHSLVVRVFDEDGDPVGDEEVRIVIEGRLKGGSLEESTDEDGYAFFETADDYEGWTKLVIYVRDQDFGPYAIRDVKYRVRLR